MVGTLTDRMREIVGREGVFSGAQALEPFLDGAGRSTRLVRVLPRDTDEALEVMELAREEELKVFSVRSRYLPEGLEKEDGLLVDASRLDQIKMVDPRNMMAHIGAGVTFEQLQPHLEEAGVRLLMPASSPSPYVVRSYLERDVLVGSVGYRHQQLSIFHAALADGSLWVSGTQQMGEEGHADFREDQGPQLSTFFGGSEDIYGIPLYGVVYLYPLREERRVLAFGFQEVENALEFSYKVCREEHCFELVGGDALWWSVLAGSDVSGVENLKLDLPPWTVLLSIEHQPELVELHQRMVESDAADMQGVGLAPPVTELLAGNLGRAWYLWERSYYHGRLRPISCYTFSDKAAALFDLAARPARETVLHGNAAQCFVPVFFGGAFYCQTDLHYAPAEEEKAARCWRDAYASLLDEGSMVDRANGELGRMVFARAKPSYLEMIKRLKRILDPGGRLNPGQLLEGI